MWQAYGSLGAYPIVNSNITQFAAVGCGGESILDYVCLMFGNCVTPCQQKHCQRCHVTRTTRITGTRTSRTHWTPFGPYMIIEYIHIHNSNTIYELLAETSASRNCPANCFATGRNSQNQRQGQSQGERSGVRAEPPWHIPAQKHLSRMSEVVSDGTPHTSGTRHSEQKWKWAACKWWAWPCHFFTASCDFAEQNRTEQKLRKLFIIIFQHVACDMLSEDVIARSQ